MCFQGSEADAVVFDVVDCAPRSALGLLLRERDNRAADRPLNVAMTRARYKFVLVANRMGMSSIYPGEGLLLRRVFDAPDESGAIVFGDGLLRLMEASIGFGGLSFFRSGSEGAAWDVFVNDLRGAKKSIFILFARALLGNVEQVNSLCEALNCATRRGARVELYGKAAKELPTGVRNHVVDVGDLPNTAFAIVDGDVLWNGLPCSWLKDYSGRRLTYDPVFRMAGGHAADEVDRIYRSKIKRMRDAGEPSDGADSSARQLALCLGV